MKESFKLYELADRKDFLIKQIKETLESSNIDKLKKLLYRLPEETSDENKSVNLVFAGQYSAGKSTTLKVLTGRNDIATGGGITTEQAQSYDWNGIKLTDTPGVHTKLRPDHDEITYRAIADSDLLVFFITNELFDSHLAHHFRQLAINRDKGHEIMLVVNKMRRTSRGNTIDIQNIIKADLAKVLAPFTPEDLYISFIDAETALESENESDQDLAALLWEKSGVDSLIEKLNSFVHDKGLAARYSTVLYSLEQILQEALSSESTGDPDLDAVEELLLQRRRALYEYKNQIPSSIEKEIQQTSTQVRKEGRIIAEMINASAKKDIIEVAIKNSKNRVEQYAEELGNKIKSVIEKNIDDLSERIASIEKSELAKELLSNISIRLEENEISPEMLSKLQKASDISTNFGTFLVKNSFTSKSGAIGNVFKLENYSGTATHNTVKAVGKFFGKKFQPWEAVKWTRKIANFGRVFAIAGTVITFVLQIKEDCDAAQIETDLRDARAGIRSGFNDAAYEIELHYDAETQTYVANIFDDEIDNIDKKLNELHTSRQEKSILFDKLSSLLTDVRKLIKDIHAV